MSELPDPAPLAPIEDLDPEPTTVARRSHRWEWLIGILLVVGIAGLGAWQWWSEQTGLDQYRSGQRAAATRDWDTAYHAYTAAGSYSDAPSRAAEARQQIADRDRQYAALLQARATGDWVAAFQAARGVAAIAPRYRDLPQLEQEAEQQVYAAALSGTIALRTQADPPGLYYYSADGWRWVAGSDRQSRVQSICTDGTLLFDSTMANVDRRALFQGVWRPGVPATSPLLDASMDGSSQYICGAAGIWGIHYPSAQGGRLFYHVLLGPISQLGFQPSGQSRFVEPQLPAAEGEPWTVLAIAPDASHLLLGRSDSSDPANPRIRVVVADPAGSARSLVDLPGEQPGSGLALLPSYSPDGRYVLLGLNRIVHPPAGGQELHKTVVLAALDGSAAPHTLIDAVLDNQPGDSGSNLIAAANFIQIGPAAGQILLLTNGLTAARIRLLDPQQTETPSADFTIERIAAPYVFTHPDPYSPVILLNWHDFDNRDPALADPIALLNLSGEGQVIHPNVATRAYAAMVTTRAGRLILVPVAGAQAPYIAHSLPLTGLADPLPASTVIFTSSLRTETSPLPDPTWRLGRGLLAYVTPTGELHARTYDGAVDLLLESGVSVLYNADPFEDLYPLQ